MTWVNAEVTCMQISVVWADSRSVSFVCGVQSASLFHSSSTVSLPFTYLHFLSDKTAHLSVCGAFQAACNSILSLWILQMYKFYSYPPIIFLHRCDHNRVLETNTKQRAICMVKMRCTKSSKYFSVLTACNQWGSFERNDAHWHQPVLQRCLDRRIQILDCSTWFWYPATQVTTGKYTLPVWPLQGRPLIPVYIVHLS